MKYFVAALIATIASAAPGETHAYDLGFQEHMEVQAIEGQKHVDQVVDTTYSLSGINNLNGDECEHAIGHDGHVRMTAAGGDVNSAGDYMRLTTMHHGKQVYVNYEAEKFMSFNGNSWVVSE